MRLALLIRNVLNSPGAGQRGWLCHLNYDKQRVVTNARKLPGLFFPCSSRIFNAWPVGTCHHRQCEQAFYFILISRL